MSVRLARLGPEDWRAWRAVRLASLAEAPEAFGSRYEDWEGAAEERWRQRLALPDSVHLVALDGEPDGHGGLCGVAATLRAVEVGTEEPGADLISMWVAPRARGTDVAARLVEEVVAAAAREWGARWVTLDVRVRNPRARRLYERCGFAVIGEHGEGETHEYRMSRRSG